jgi:hypothetical protein
MEWKIQLLVPAIFRHVFLEGAGLLAAWRRRRATLRVMASPAMEMKATQGQTGQSLTGQTSCRGAPRWCVLPPTEGLPVGVTQL